MSTVGILLAAGRGRRFAPQGTSNKLLAPLPSGEAVVAASARALLAVLPRVIAVVAPGDNAAGQVLRAAGCEVHVCHDADRGMAASLVHALRQSLPDAKSWLIALGDMPHVKTSTIAALCAQLGEGADIAVPVHQGRRGNPVAFSGRHLPALLALEGDQGARAILQSCQVHPVAVDDPGIFHDIDTPSDLHKTVHSQ